MSVQKLIRRSGVKLSIANAAAGGTVNINDEAHTLDANGTARLQHPGATSIVVKKGVTPAVLDTDYVIAIVDAYRHVVALSGSSVLAASDAITVSYSYTATGSTPGTPVSVGRPKQAININDSRGTQTITDFDTVASAIADQITEGRTVSISWTSNLVTDDDGFEAIEEAYNADELVWLKIEATAIDGVTKKTWGYLGFINQLNVTLNESGVAEGSFTFAATELYTWA